MCAEQLYCSEEPNQPVFCLEGELNYSGALNLHAISGFSPLILVHVNFSPTVFILVELKICFRLSFSIIFLHAAKPH